MAETRSITIRNTASGPRGINTVGGLVMVDPGKSADVELSAAEADSLPDYFSEGEAKSLSANTKAELVEIANAEGVAIETDDNKADLIRKIEEKRSPAG